MKKTIIFMAGSIREGSYSASLAFFAYNYAKEIFKNDELKYIDLKNYDLPIYNQDLELKEGMPAKVNEIKKHFFDADAFFIVTPEYNGFMSPILKNTLDWISRSKNVDDNKMSAFFNKAAAICSTSPGNMGGIRALPSLRLLLANLSVNVVGQQLALSSAYNAFNENGKIKDSNTEIKLKNILNSLKKII